MSGTTHTTAAGQGRSSAVPSASPKGVADNVTLHPAAVLTALDAEADAWAAETNLASTVNRMSEDPHIRDILNRFARQCFAEGAYRGAMRATSNKLQTIPSTPQPLPPSVKRALEYRRAGWSTKMIATEFGITPGAVSKYIHTAKMKGHDTKPPSYRVQVAPTGAPKGWRKKRQQPAAPIEER